MEVKEPESDWLSMPLKKIAICHDPEIGDETIFVRDMGDGTYRLDNNPIRAMFDYSLPRFGDRIWIDEETKKIEILERFRPSAYAAVEALSNITVVRK